MESKQSSEITRPYEMVVLMHPDSTEDQHKELFRRNKSIIESFKGRIHNIDTWGKRNLANPIEKHKKATYFHCTFVAAPAAVAELERTMGINDRVLRFAHTRLEDGTDLSLHMEKFKQALADATAREREREAKSAARKAMSRGGGFRDGGPRDGGPRDGGFRDGGPREGGPHRGHRDGGRDFGGLSEDEEGRE